MPRRSLSVCSVPGCPNLTADGKCGTHRKTSRRAHDATRETSARRGYGATWRRRRARFLALHPNCVLCPARSEVPDHWPVTRRELVARGDPDPDADHHLRALCTSCHNSETARAARAGSPNRRR